jgi:pyrroline-5-carboxylate reductase
VTADRERFRLGILGTGALGGAIARAVLDRGVVPPDALVLANRSGRGDVPGVRLVTEPQALVNLSDLILLALPPAALPDLQLRAPDLPILSVVAGATVRRLARITGSPRILRAMSNPTAAAGLAFSPVFAAPAATAADRARAARVLGACGVVEFIDDEAQIDVFTALTGPVPGFVAFFARCMVEHATRAGIAPEVADRAVRQLFLASGAALADGPTAAEHVRAMIDYAGTTAAGLAVLEASDVGEMIHRSLEAAAARARSIVPEEG